MSGLGRRAVIAGGAVALVARPASAAAPTLMLSGRYQQGGFAIGRTLPRADVLLDGEKVGRASPEGLFVVGFDRDAAPETTIVVRASEVSAEHRAAIAKGDFDIQRIDGLPADQVTPEDPRLLERINRENQRKSAGFASNIDAAHFETGFDMPLDAIRVSGKFGGQRILNGEAKRPHYGADLAAPVGTAIRAPCAGVVSFAETGLHYEGGLVMIDHGQGLISVYLHMSQVAVKKGETVFRGARIGAVGQEGRATGPHLCWRLKWHGRNLDPTLLVGARAPAKI